ncbi:MAG: AAA family ATPase [Bacteroidetes bacterium]|nr:AAA family ATPase [Bacteroidota bacterium]
MAEIKDIHNNFQEELLQSSFKAKVVSGNVDWKNNPILLKVEQIEANQILFSIKENPLRLSIENPNNTIFSNGLFWITDYGNNVVELKYLPGGSIQFFNDTLDIGFGDNIVLSKKNAKIDKLSEYFLNDYVFQSDIGDLIFVETYPSNTDLSFTIHGFNKRVDIVVKDNKWLMLKERNKPFTKKHEDFLSLNIALYPTIRFVESSKAKEAVETIKAEEAKGNTLISLWKIYSEIELQRATDLKEKIGELNFTIIRHLDDGISRIRINNLSEDLKSTIKDNKDDLQNTSLEVPNENENEIKSDNSKRFRVKSVNNDFSFDLYDELETLPDNGKLEVSLIGDEIVNKRRERALKSLRENRIFVTQNLLFAIEGLADAMLIKKRNEKALTDRTRKFLKDKFGISDLTTNQKEAVEIAINTPDVAVIQGPPGTGKSTVVAAICDRLIEIAEKSKKDDTKLILVSAFQNDTVEHIASKIYTLGLPTIKIGKETQSNIRVEDELIKEIRLNIDNSLQNLSTKGNAHRVSKRLNDLKNLYESENNEEKLKSEIETLIKTISISDDLWNSWQEINGNAKFNDASLEKNIKLLRGVRTNIQSYNDDGYEKIVRLQKSDLPFSNSEKDILEDAPFDNPDESFLDKIKQLQEKYLEQLNAMDTTISSGNNLAIIDWLNMAIQYFKQKEAIDYQDEETFLSAILEELRDDLDGNAEYIRNTIKDYGESLAATNQVAGGKEMSAYSKIDNVILEEAARSNPLDLLIPMTKATERIIMVGDQNQLPHLLEDDIAEETSTKLADKFLTIETRKKLEESLFGVIFKNLGGANPKRTITLTEQFRMHPFIGDFISKVYYRGELKAGMSNQADLKKHNLSIAWAQDKVAVFCDVKKALGIEESGKSKSRKSEAVRIVKLLDELKTDQNFDNLSVGIITFYAKQVDEIFREASKKGYTEQRADGSFEITLPYRETDDGREKLRIGSVDSFQGKEFDIVILSTVRSNTISRTHENYKKVFGFLTLENRLNVAFSRSQKLLIVVGDSEMLSDDFAKTYVEGLHEFYTNLSTDKQYGNRIQ